MADPTPPEPMTSALALIQVASLAAYAADEALAVEHVGEQRSVLPFQQGIGRAGNSRRRAHFVRELDGGLLVRHRHQRATDVGDFEQLSEEGRIVGTLIPIGITTASMPAFSK